MVAHGDFASPTVRSGGMQPEDEFLEHTLRHRYTAQRRGFYFPFTQRVHRRLPEQA